MRGPSTSRGLALAFLALLATTACASADDSAAGQLLGRIDSFGFDSRAAMGVGGFITTRIFPVVLFKNGDALTDVAGLGDAGGLDAHRRAHPDAWTRWRRAGGVLEIERRKGWEKLPFQKTFARLPAAFRLDGLFRALGGTGNVAVGGGDSVAAWTDYRFTRDGAVTRGGGAGGRAERGGGSVATAARAGERRGRYQIDGLAVAITYDDGTRERRILVTDPDDPRSPIWLDGEAYVRR